MTTTRLPTIPFTQIVSCFTADRIYALDVHGRVWVHSPLMGAGSGWQPIADPDPRHFA